CNPRAIFDRLLESEDLRQLKHVWSFANLEIKREFDGQFAAHPRVSSVLTGSLEYYRTLSTAKYLVNNQTFPPNFTKRQEQVYLNTWHGTPLKKMGYDSPIDGPHGSRNMVRNLLSADYILSPSQYTTEQLYEESFRLRGIYRGTVIEEGYPRIDQQFLDRVTEKQVRAELEAAGLWIGDRRVVLYAPTWRGSSVSKPRQDAEALYADVLELSEQLGSGYMVLLRAHHLVHNTLAAHEQLSQHLVPKSYPTNRLLGYVDVLVTDYSSIFFDFLATSRPIVFHAPDESRYEQERGFVIDLTELPGPVCDTMSRVAVSVRAVATGSADDPFVTHGERYRHAVRRYCPREDGHVTDRVIDTVFRGRPADYRLHDG